MSPVGLEAPMEARVKSKLRSRSKDGKNLVYRIMATDSNVLSGYFQHGFQCPTQSSTYQRKKPIAYDLAIGNDEIVKPLRRRPQTALRR